MSPEPSQDSPFADAASDQADNGPLQRLLPWVVGVATAVGCAWLGQLYFVTRVENRLLASQQALADLELRSARHQLEAERVIARRQLSLLKSDARRALDPAQWQLAMLHGNASEAVGVLAWNPTTQEGVFRGERLPATGAHEAYALWLIDPAKPQPIGAGTITIDASGAGRLVFRVSSAVGRTLKFSVTRERENATALPSSPQGPEVLLGE